MPIPRGSYLDATFRQLDRQIACRYRLCGDITVWPFELVGAEYYSSPAPHAGARRFGRRRGAGGPAADPDAPLDGAIRGRTLGGRRAEEAGADDCRLPNLPAAALFRWRRGRRGCAVRAAVCPLPGNLFPPPRSVRRSRRRSRPRRNACSRSASSTDDALFPTDHRVFEGFDLLREYFAFPRKFLGCRLTGIDEVLSRIKARTVDIVFAFDELNTRLAAAVRPQTVRALCGTRHQSVREDHRSHPAESQASTNITSSPIAATIWTTSRIACWRCMRTIPAAGKGSGAAALFGLARRLRRAASDTCFSVRRLPRRRTVEEKRAGVSSDYTGTDMFISLERTRRH